MYIYCSVQISRMQEVWDSAESEISELKERSVFGYGYIHYIDTPERAAVHMSCVFVCTF